MLQLLYRSIAVDPEFSKSDLDILRASLPYNRAHGISGFLWRADMQFFQALAGPKEKVRPLFEKIQRDARHHSIEVLINEQREWVKPFRGWAMGYDVVGAEIAGFGLRADGTRPPISQKGAVRIFEEMHRAADETESHGSLFPYARRPGEPEDRYYSRLGLS